MASSVVRRNKAYGNPIRICPQHPRKKIVSVCNTCGEQFVCLLCIAAAHTGHRLVETDDYLNVKKVSLSGLLVDSEAKIKTVDERVEKVQQYRADNKKILEHTIQTVESRGTELKAEIDKIIKDFTQRSKEVGEKNMEILEAIEKKLLSQLTDITAIVNKCKNALANDKNADMGSLEKSLRIENSRPFKPFPVLQLPSLIAEEDPAAQQLILFGSMNIKDWRLEIFDPNDDDLISDTSSSITGKSKLKATSVKAIASFRHVTQGRISTVAPTLDGKAWIVKGGGCEADLMLQSGDTKHTTVVESYLNILDLMVKADSTKTVLLCSDGTIRNILQTGKTNTMYRTKYPVTSLCESAEGGNIWFTQDDGKVVKYSRDGEISQTINTDPSGRKLFSMPIRVRVNRRTGDMVVIEDSLPRHVLIMDKRNNILFRFHGDLTLDERENHVEDGEGQGRTRFIPTAVCFDRNNNVIVCDIGSKSVMLVDRRGRATKSLWRDGNMPTSCGTQPNGDLWVGFSNGKLKVLRYLS
ncbi:uncharacterized protein LOC110452891 [Mizuhopecten yessoensis]|uniref:E3 ubiquitin-protein ligase TRIM56 n=1 Tax=Mizuhopecten yessoensis TaxID=6573 RepID=A0A210QIM2_MIZYE|nr:uncharacterized protein LOC110452891 [Mizuhopecten yessoensis]OWF48590.1 E3 ubiquitin-protein ligase TRIM56 [Mizuhopecten yessoensis]